MSTLNGSFSVEAAVITPLLLFIMLLAINAGIHLWQETVEFTDLLKEREMTDIIDCMYHIKSMENLIGEINGD